MDNTSRQFTTVPLSELSWETDEVIARPPKKKSRVLRVVLIILISFFVIAGVLFAYGYYILLPRVGEEILDDVTSLGGDIMDDLASLVEPLPEQTMKDTASPQLLSVKDYDELLKKPLSEIDEGVAVGPARLKFSNFWEIDETRSVWIDVLLPILPNFVFDAKLAKIVITKVDGALGNNVYDGTNDFERPFFHTIALSEQNTPQPHLKGVRDVSLLPGTKEGDVARAKGVLVLTLPIGVVSGDFSVEDVGTRKKVSGTTIGVSAMDGSQVLWEYSGDGAYFLTMKAFNAAGAELKPALGASSPLGDTMYDRPVSLTGLFQGVVSSVQFFVAEEIVERSYPFELEK